MLRVSRNTVSNAYEVLGLEGLIVGIEGSCTRVRGVSTSRASPVAKRLDVGTILRAAHFPQNWARIDDPDGNPLYAYR